MSLRDASVLDGGMGTLLESLAPSDEKDVASPLWSAAFLLGREDVVREAHRRFRRAGADVLTTTSYQLSKESLERAGVDAARLTALFGAPVIFIIFGAGPLPHIAQHVIELEVIGLELAYG